MMQPTGQALRMRLELKQLGQRFGVAPRPVTIPLAMATQHPMILAGFAATTDLDLDRTKLRAFAFGYPLRHPRGLQLLYKHDTAQVAGTIQDLEYADDGSLCVRAEVHHPIARRAGAFS